MSETRPLLLERQVQESQEELRRIDEMLNAPPHIRTKISDIRGMASRRRRLKQELEENTPRPYSEKEKDAAVKRFKQLGEEIRVGMPSNEIMRRNPPGAVQQHQAWDRRNKKKALERRHIGQRLQASGDLDDTLGEAALSVEMLRTRATGFDLPLDGAQIPRGTDYHIPAQPQSVVLSDEEIETLEDLDPELASQLVMMDADTRAKIKEILKTFTQEAAEEDAAPTSPAPVHHFARIGKLRRLCNEHGIRSRQLNADGMIAALAEKGVTVDF